MFDLGLTEDQQRKAGEWHDFAATVIRPVAAQHDREQSMPWEVLEEAARRGIYAPQFYGDGISDPTGLSLVLATEEIFWGCAGIGLQLMVPALALSGLASSGTPEQLFRWAPDCFGTPGDLKLGALAVTEPTGGSDVAALRTTARRDGEDWVLNGRKTFVGNGGIADVHIVVASVDADLGHRGQAQFVVTKDAPGLKAVRKLDKLGLRAAYTGEFEMVDCRIPGDQLLGGDEKLERRLDRGRRGESSGGSSALQALERTRPAVGAQAIGVARAAYEYARDYARERRSFGVPIAEHTPIAYKLADMALEIDAARLLVWRAAWMAAQGKTYYQSEGSMSKLKGSELATRVSEQALQVLGGHGFTADHPVEKWYRDAKVFDIYEGTSEIQRMVIAKAVREDAGLPIHLAHAHG